MSRDRIRLLETASGTSPIVLKIVPTQRQMNISIDRTVRYASKPIHRELLGGHTIIVLGLLSVIVLLRVRLHLMHKPQRRASQTLRQRHRSTDGTLSCAEQ